MSIYETPYVQEGNKRPNEHFQKVKDIVKRINFNNVKKKLGNPSSIDQPK